MQKLSRLCRWRLSVFFFQAEDGIRDYKVTGVQTCALPISYTAAVARRLGVAEPDLTDIYRGALLHDVGKIGIPDAILRKPGKLTPEEWVEMRRHPEIGYRILHGINFMEAAREIVLSHKE